MKLKIKNAVYSVKPKQVEGKLLVRYDKFSVKPKRIDHGKIRVLSYSFSVKPKPDGVKIYRFKERSVFKLDSESGVKLYLAKRKSVFKTDERFGTRIYQRNKVSVLKQTCDGTIFTWDATASVFRPQTNNISNSMSAGVGLIFFQNLLTRVYDTERPIVIGVTWSNTISGGAGGVNFPDGNYPETISSIYYTTEIRRTPTAVDNSTGSVFDRLLGLTAMSGSTGITFPFDSVAGNYWFRVQAGFTSSTPTIFKPSGTKVIRDFTIRNVSDRDALLGRFLMGFRVT